MTMAATAQRGIPGPVMMDRALVLALFGLLTLGLLMVASASIVVSEKLYGVPFHYLIRQTIYLGMGLVGTYCLLKIEMRTWEKYSGPILIFALCLLVIVLIPGLGKSINGSRRWLGIGPFGGQVSEFAKLAVVIYLGGYIVRRQDELRSSFQGFLKPMCLLGVVSILLLLEPDFGATTVIILTAMSMLFLAGVRLSHFMVLVVVVALTLGILAVSSPYRLERLTGFLNPWANQFDSGYQLTQSLIAFGRGGWIGVGLGDSIQKLFYLPEAHTDFVFAVIAEELGLVGILFTIGLFVLLVWRALLIAKRAARIGQHFNAYVCAGLGLWIALQALINIGVSAGILPTKGLTLPFISYGGSSLIVNCLVMALLLRADYEMRLHGGLKKGPAKRPKRTKNRRG